ncbi:putative polysaccharide biosynthesis protein [Aquimarina sp. MAR_2010_214]|uniref:sugar-transfer associated ATP-grasp domain-containing protein n=1 Tax=Aquimarina sp. MAR_2010_214 TaxID=1250026 RepID=UPI000C6FE017|nr:sugar-transfer associated ATP-grasp domain-containing protein [Aquimarina sp. MAR_2010_214]PKV50987.1 putative polysaccharide biosynthesis protein [Aquimarina sp. MAR_2010_214]
MKTKLLLLQKRFLVFFNDKNRKGIIQIIKEVLVFWIIKQELPYFYFGKFLYRKDVKNYKDYLSSKEIDKITLSTNLHHFQYASLLRNKLAFSYYMESNNMPVPSLLSHNLKGRFYYQSNLQQVNTVEDLCDFFKNLFEVTGKTKVFVKSIIEMGGTGAYLITKQNLEKEIKAYGFYILNNDCIHQEVIEQHQGINKIYKHSVNTIRFDTYLDKNNTIHILSAFMRFGRGGSVIDNGSLGGFYISVDINKGTLRGKSHQLMKYGGEQLHAHPDTGIVFDDYEIPYFKESCELIKRAVSFIPDRIIGWDIAIGTDGPIIIEGNDNNSFVTPDIAYGGYLKHPVFKEIMEEA